MKIPAAPPEIYTRIKNLMEQGRLFDASRAIEIVDGKGEYTHWEKIRFLKNDLGLTQEEYWSILKFMREGVASKIEYTDKHQHKFSFCEPPILKEYLRKFDLLTGGIVGSSNPINEKEARAYISKSLSEEPYSSSFMEGAATTKKIAKELIFENRKPTNENEQMVYNNHKAMEFIKEYKYQPLTEAIILELHKITTQNILPDNQAGYYRNSNDIHVVSKDGDILHTPPSFEHLEERMQSIIAFANAENTRTDWIHPLIRAFILHFMIAYEHPFTDGNGRVARALFYWSALKSGHWMLEYASISQAILKKHTQYGKAFLYVETDSADLTYFLIYHAEILDQAIQDLQSYIERKINEAQNIEKRLSNRSHPKPLNTRQGELIKAFHRGEKHSMSIEIYTEIHKTSYQTARADLEELFLMGYVRKHRLGKVSIYRPVENLAETVTKP